MSQPLGPNEVILQSLVCARGIRLPKVTGRAIGGVFAPVLACCVADDGGSVDDPALDVQMCPPEGGPPCVAGTPIRASPPPATAVDEILV